jgi:hypothetical protein
MKTFVYFILTCFISTGALLGALHAKNPYPAFAIAFGAWLLFIWGCNRRARREAEKRYREQLFEDYMRYKMRNDRRW